MTKFIYKNIKTGKVLAEGFDSSRVYDEAVKSLKSINFEGEEIDVSDDSDIFDSLEDKVWEYSEEWIYPKSPKDWDIEIWQGNIDKDEFTRLVINSLVKSGEGLGFLKELYQYHDIFNVVI